jgi:hypothetical protein
MMQTIECRYCHGRIGPHWQVFEHVRCGVASEPTPQPSQAFRRSIKGWDMMRSLTRELTRPHPHHQRRQKHARH